MLEALQLRNVHQNGKLQTTNVYKHLDVSENRGTPKSSILIGFSIINHPFRGTPIFGNTHLLLTSDPNKARKGVGNPKESFDSPFIPIICFSGFFFEMTQTQTLEIQTKHLPL